MSKASKKKKNEQIANVAQIDETSLFARISKIIEKRKFRAGMYANREVTLIYWEIGHYIRSTVLDGERAEYGKKVVVTLSRRLVGKYGQSFDIDNLRRMIRFAENFTDYKIVATLSPQLSWSHFVELLPLKSDEARLYYAQEASTRRLGIRELRRQISRKAFERQEIANTNVAVELKVGKFKPIYMGQMRFYSKWLNRYEKQTDENVPIGIILCTEASREQIELMELDKEGIAVAEYWTNLPPKAEFERKISEILVETKERLERRKMLPNTQIQKEIEYFYEPYD